MLHTMQPMSYVGRDARGDSLLERGILGVGERLGLLAGVVLAVSAFTGWYSGPGQGVKVSVTGWDSGYPGKPVFFLGIAAVLVVVLREVGVTLPAAFPESLITIALGALATVLVLVRVLLDPGRLLLRRPRRRDLDQPRRRDRSHRGRSARSIRRDVTSSRGPAAGHRLQRPHVGLGRRRRRAVVRAPARARSRATKIDDDRARRRRHVAATRCAAAGVDGPGRAHGL